MEDRVTEQCWVEFADGGGEMPSYWGVVCRRSNGESAEIEAHGTEHDAAIACSELNDQAMAKRRELQAAYEAGVRRAAGTGRLTRQANGVFAAARAAGLTVEPIAGKNAFRPR